MDSADNPNVKNFEVGDALTFSEHDSGLMQGFVRTSKVRGSFFLLGGHVAEFQPAGSDAVLFMSEHATFEEGKAIRGGVPICFPWFGPKKDASGTVDPNAPAHGLVRTDIWRMTESSVLDGRVKICLEYELEGLELKYRVGFGEELTLDLEVHNTSAQLQEPEIALHTYFVVSDSSQVSIHGLEEISFLDQLTSVTEAASNEAIRFAEETDRIYHAKVNEILLRDPGLNRQICLQPRASNSTVVWNPWVDKSQRMPDFGDEEFRQMCCIETASIRPHAMQLEPGSKGSIGVVISVASLPAS